MCFSASASFGISAALGVAGIITLKKVSSPNQIPFALMPLIFSIQQLSEGFVWLSLENVTSVGGTAPVYIFLFFAQLFWPFWVPLSLYILENNHWRKKILLVLVILSFVDVLFLWNGLVKYDVSASISDFHVKYEIDTANKLMRYNYIIYLMCTVGSLFISSVRKMYILGLIIAGSAILTILYFKEYFISVWCFFAAGISAYILVILNDLKKNKSENLESVPEIIKIDSHSEV